MPTSAARSAARVRETLAALHRLDEDLYGRVARSHSPALDAVLPRISHAANWSRLWLAAAAALAASGDRRARQAAFRGVVALAATSVIVNGPIKFLVRRRRPEWSAVPIARLLRRMPVTFSFPSGHTASAAAFATAVARELPEAGPVVGVLAAAVGYSRVYTGAHYPGDVLAGAAIGALVGANARRLTPGRSVDVERSLTIERTDPLPGGKGLAVVVNASSGSALAADPRDRIREALPAASIVERDDVLEAVRAATKAADDALGVAGGDGTVNAAAKAAMERDLRLAIFPAGTLNHFARDCGLDDVEDAEKALSDGTITRVDVGRMADRIFLNTASFGSYPEMVDMRESMEDRLGKWPAAAVALARVLARAKPTKVRLNGRPRSVWTIFIGNGRYEPSGFVPSARPRLDDGRLDVRLLLAEGSWSRVRAVAAMLSGRLANSRVYEEQLVDTLDIESLEGPLRLACDGETFDGPARVGVDKQRRALAVFVPAPD